MSEQIHQQCLTTDLPRYIVEGPLPTRSGRIFRGYRVRSNNEQNHHGVSMVCKVALLKSPQQQNHPSQLPSTPSTATSNGTSTTTNRIGTSINSTSSSASSSYSTLTPSGTTNANNKNTPSKTTTTNNNYSANTATTSTSISASSLEEELKRHSQELHRVYNAVSNAETHPHILPYQRWIFPLYASLSSSNSNSSSDTSSNLSQHLTKKKIFLNHPTSSSSYTNPSSTSTMLASALPISSSSISSSTATASASGVGTTLLQQLQQQPVYLLRQHCYTTLSDRLASRPFLSRVEKLWIIYQILCALQSLHESNICHGHLTTDNIMVTSWNWVILTDISSHIKPTFLPKDDPSIFIQYFQKSYQQQPTNTTDTDISKRCYIAPERFYNTRTTTSSNTPINTDTTRASSVTALTPAMDIFSAGCVIMETMVNDSACELGDIMEYGTKKTLPDTIVRKLNKIKSSSLRAACRHMLSLDPNERKMASTYRQRLQETGVFPPCFSTYLWPFLRRLRSDFKSPDSRIAYAASSYTSAILHTTTSSNCEYSCISDNNNTNDSYGTYFDLLVGTTAREIMNVGDVTVSTNLSTQTDTEASSSRTSSNNNNDLFSNGTTATATTTSSSPSQVSPDTLLIYLQVTLASLRHVQRPSSKLVALQLIQKSSNFLSDDARLQRIVPYVVSLLDDTHASVRASSIRVLASVLSLLQGFPPSDSLVFPQYIFKRVSPLLHDESISVRVAFAESMATLAETAHRFLDVTHATRLYEAVGGTVLSGATSSTGSNSTSTKEIVNEVSKTTSMKANTSRTSMGLVSPFSYDVTKLLDQGSEREPDNVVSKERKSDTTQQQQQFNPLSTVSLSKKSTSSAVSEVLIPNTYDTELAALQEIVLDWIVHIATDSSSYATFLKRALLSDLARLCAFFGRDGVTSLILPQILAFLNNRADWQLRATLTRHLPSACAVVGRVATQHFVVPCVETAIFDEEEQVTSQALICLASLVNLGLLTRTMILGSTSRQITDGTISTTVSRTTATSTSPLSSSARQTSDSPGLLEKYAPLLLHPSKGIRQGMHSLISATCKSIGYPDDFIFVLPILMPYLKYEPSSKELCCIDDLENCFVEPISKSAFEQEVNRLMQIKASNSMAQTSNGDLRTSYSKRNDNVIHFSSDDCVDMGVLVQSANEAAVECSFLVSSESNAAVESYPRQRLEGWPRDVSLKDGGSDLTTQDPIEYEKIYAMHCYLAMTSNYRQSISPRSPSSSLFRNLPTPNMSSAYTFLFPNQKFVELFSDTIPQWYEEVREAAQKESSRSIASSFRSLTSVAVTYGIAITAPLNSSQISRKWKGDTTFTLDDIMIESLMVIGDKSDVSSSDRQKSLLQSYDSRMIASALQGEWGSMVEIDPIFVDLTLLIEKIQSLHIPPLPPRLGVLQDVNGRPFSWHGPVAVPNEAHEDVPSRTDWKPSIESVVISSSTKSEHTAAVTRLAVSQDQQFFVSTSHDGTSRVWNLNDVQDSPTLKSALTYSGHMKDDYDKFGVRINDVCIIENSHSVATCASNGGVHVWRVDLASAAKTGMLPSSSTSTSDRGLSRVLGSSVIRHIDYKKEGEVVAVSHFNTSSSSILAFVTEKGVIHSWDLRCAAEPFQFHVQPELGYLTTFSTLFDRNSFVTGTSRGYISLMDVRYQLCVKVWRHSSESLVSRLATCFTTLPQDKDGKSQTSAYGIEPRPYIFMGCGNNEASVFDISTARCRQCFRTLDQSLCYINQQMRLPSECISMPELNEIPLPRNPNRPIISAIASNSLLHPNIKYSNSHSETKVLSLMGRLGMHGQQQQYLITGGSDRFLRYWDFSSPSKCYTISGLAQGQPRPIYQRVDVGSPDQQLFLCQQMPVPNVDDFDSVRYSWKLQRGLVRPENIHQGSILDLKSIEYPSKGMLSCSQDGMIKLWR